MPYNRVLGLNRRQEGSRHDQQLPAAYLEAPSILGIKSSG